MYGDGGVHTELFIYLARFVRLEKKAHFKIVTFNTFTISNGKTIKQNI